MTIRFLADEDLDRNIVFGLRNREPSLDILDTHESGLRRLDDRGLLEAAAMQGRSVVSHDRHTMTRYFLERVGAGKSTPGLFVVPQQRAIGEIIDSLLLIWSASAAEEWRDGIFYLPFR